MRQKIMAVIKNNFFQGSVIYVAANFIGGIMNYLFNSLTAKSLGPAQYSEITTLFSYAVIFSVPTSIVSNEIIRRLGSVSKDRIKQIFLWENWLIVKLKRYWWLVIPYFCSLFFLPKLMNLSFYFSFILLLAIFFSFIGAFYGAVLQGLHLFLISMLLVLFGFLLKLVGGILVFLKVDGLMTVGIFLILSSALPVLSSVIYFKKRYLNDSKKILVKSIRKVFSSQSLLILSFSLISMSLLNNLDMIFVKKFFSAEQAGYYGAWNLLAKIIFYIIGPVTNIAYIFFSSKEKEKDHKKALGLIILLYLLSGSVLAIIYGLFGKEIILLIFNEKYLVIQPYLVTAAVVGIFYSLIVIINNYFLAIKSKAGLLGFIGVILYGTIFIFFGKSLQNIYFINFFSLSFCLALYTLFLAKESA